MVLVLFVFVHIDSASASPITDCQIIKNVAGSPKKSIPKIVCPLRNVVKGGIERASSPVNKSPNLRLSIFMKILFIVNVNSPDKTQIAKTEYFPKNVCPKNSANGTEIKNKITVSIALNKNA
jgi:hypothetical protein